MEGAASSQSAPMTTLATFAPPSPLSLTNDSTDKRRQWKIWRKRWDAYACVSGLATKEADVQLATLTMCLGEEALEILETLPFTGSSERKDLAKNLEILEKHFTGGVNVTYERFQFFKRDQLSGGSFRSNSTALRTLASRHV